MKDKNIQKLIDAESNIIQSGEVSELQGALIELNKDDFDYRQKTSGIDLRTRLHSMEITSILAIDSLVRLNFLPSSISFLTSQKKRLNVSLGGEGRKEIVQLTSNKREMDSGQTFTQKLGGLFKFGGDKNV